MNFSFCIPTRNRPLIVERLLNNLLNQSILPHETIIVDASDSRETEVICKSELYVNLNIKYILPRRPGLTFQRILGIKACESDFIFMLDDDVILDRYCAESLLNYLYVNPELGALGAVITNEFGKKWFFKHKLFNRLGLISNLRPGSYTKFGDFLQLSFFNKEISGFVSTDFLAAGASMFRVSAILKCLPDENYRFGGEDKHWTLRLGKFYRIGILGEAKLFHEHFPGGARKKPFMQSRILQENMYIIFNEHNFVRPNLIERVSFISYHWFSFLFDIFGLITMSPKTFFKTFNLSFGRFVGLLNLSLFGYKGLKYRVKNSEK